jgi:hypothetical protein
MSDRYTPAEALDLLVDGFDEELDGWSAIVADASAEPARKRGVRGMPSLRLGMRVRLGLLAAGVAAAAALIVTSPWKTAGPAGISDARAAQILRNVQAATPPQPGWILHDRTRETVVLIPESGSGRPIVRRSQMSESWTQTTPPYHWRELSSHGSLTLEQGASFQSDCGVHYYFDPTTMVLARRELYPGPCAVETPDDTGLFYDHDKFLRNFVAKGWLTVVGQTRIDGEDVYQLEPSHRYWFVTDQKLYVDAKSYRLVREDITFTTSATGSCNPGYRLERTISDYPTREYLPPTAANLALTDIQKQHPDARTSTFDQLPQSSRRLFQPVLPQCEGPVPGPSSQTGPER